MQELIRCKDCKFAGKSSGVVRNTVKCNYEKCPTSHRVVPQDYFCPYAEKGNFTQEDITYDLERRLKRKGAMGNNCIIKLSEVVPMIDCATKVRVRCIDEDHTMWTDGGDVPKYMDDLEVLDIAAGFGCVWLTVESLG